MEAKKVRLDCTVNFELSLTSDEVEIKILDVINENKYLSVGLKNKMGIGKVNVVISTDDLKKILKNVE